MLKRLRQNLGIKFICFLVASFLWIYVAASQNTVGKFPRSIGIKAINIQAGLVASYDVRTVEIKIMADPSVWRKLSPESFSAYIDLSSDSAGTYELPISVISSVPGVQIVEKTPGKVLVSLEPIITKEVEISKKVEGSASDGMIAGTIKLEPDKVQVRGAKSLIDNIIEGTVIISLNKEGESFKKLYPIIALDEQGEVVSALEFLPSEVMADVAIVKAANNKTVGLKVKTSGSPKSGYYISSITTVPSVVDIIAPRTVISDINLVETYAVDINNASSDIEKEVSLNLPDGVSLQAGTLSRARIKISFASNEMSKEIIVPIDFINLDQGFMVTDISPSQIKAIVSGPVETVMNLKSADLGLTLDLKNKIGGVFTFDVPPASIKVPENITIISILPSAVSITTEKK